MQALALTGFDQPATILTDLPAPTAGAGEVAVRVHASSVNPVDNAIAAGMLRGMAEYEFPVILGRDFAGVVEQAGPGVTEVAVGDRVFGYVPHVDPAVHAGSWTELAIVKQADLARIPDGVAFDAAGATPLAGITALFAVDAVGVGDGQTLLIVGATGGVGSFAIQLAVHAGAHVIATGLAEDREYLRGLGAAEVVARDGDVAATVREGHPAGVDAIIDVVSFTPDAFAAYAPALKDGGSAASPVGGAGDGPGRHMIMASSDPAALTRLAQHLADGTVRAPIHETFSLARAGEALAALPAAHTQGKLAITVP